MDELDRWGSLRAPVKDKSDGEFLGNLEDGGVVLRDEGRLYSLRFDHLYWLFVYVLKKGNQG